MAGQARIKSTSVGHQIVEIIRLQHDFIMGIILASTTPTHSNNYCTMMAKLEEQYTKVLKLCSIRRVQEMGYNQSKGGFRIGIRF